MSTPVIPERLVIEPAADAGAPFTRTAGAALIAGFVLMAAGAVAWSTSGLDLDAAVEAGTIPQLLPDIAASSTKLGAMSALWLCGMVAFTVAGGTLARLGRPHPMTTAAAWIMGLGAAMASVSYVMWAALTSLATAGGTNAELAQALGFLASKTDWVATIWVLAIPLPLIIAHGQGDWAPRWLRYPAAACALCGVLTGVALVTGTGLATFGFALVPVGMATTLITGVLLWRA